MKFTPKEQQRIKKLKEMGWEEQHFLPAEMVVLASRPDKTGKTARLMATTARDALLKNN